MLEKLNENPSYRRITGLRMTPRLISGGRAREEAIHGTLHSHGLTWLLTPVDREALRDAGFSRDDICRNIVLFKGAQRVLNRRGRQGTAFAEKVTELHGKACSKDNPQGWIIAALKKIVRSSDVTGGGRD